MISPGARSEAASLEARIASVDRLTDQHRALIHLAAELPDSVRRLSSERETAALGALSYKLTRTSARPRTPPL